MLIFSYINFHVIFERQIWDSRELANKLLLWINKITFALVYCLLNYCLKPLR